MQKNTEPHSRASAACRVGNETSPVRVRQSAPRPRLNIDCRPAEYCRAYLRSTVSHNSKDPSDLTAPRSLPSGLAFTL